ncbi:MAG: hypothetical protein JSS43_00220 [Proteobacteria bacterium]|nr:hypothetical protein [Pseudomonadota bacterium]
MIATMIAVILRNLPAFLLIIALIISLLGPRTAERTLSWILLLPVGVSGLWAAFFHLFFPSVAAADIGWATSPFQFEVGLADLAIGVTACVAYRASLPFKAASVCVASIFLLGAAAGHVRQMIVAGNFHPGNAGVPFVLDITAPVLAIALLAVAWRGRPGSAWRR